MIRVGHCPVQTQPRLTASAMRNLLTCLAVVCILAGCKREFADLSTGTIAATPINPQPGATVSISMRVTNFG